eukprot:4319694-Prymnesium_polylepis.1
MHTASREPRLPRNTPTAHRVEPAVLHTALAVLISFESVFRSAYSSSSRARLAARAHGLRAQLRRRR